MIRLTPNLISNDIEDNAYKNIYILTSEDDLDNINKNCVASVANGASNIPQNYPSDFGTLAGVVITSLFLKNNTKFKSQIAFTYSSPTKIRTRSMQNGSTWTEWNELINSNLEELKNDAYKNIYRLTSEDNLDNINENCVASVANNDIPQNYPSDFGASASVVITSLFLKNNTKFKTQLVIKFNAPIYISFRSMANQVWSEWSRIDNVNLNDKSFLNEGTTNAAQITDLNTINLNTVYQVIINSNPSNWPFGNDGGSIITNKFSTTYLTQIAIPYQIEKTQLMAFRIKHNNTWQTWQYVKSIIRNHGKKYIAFGDSTTWGYSSDHSHEQSPYNYPACVGKLIDIEVVNMADPAQGLLKDWSEGTTGNFAIIPTITEMINNHEFDDVVLITVGWAYNDASICTTVDFGNVDDSIPESTDGITTWLGYYAKILDILQKAAPQAMVILITGYGNTSNVEGHKTDDQYTALRTFKDGKKTHREMYNALEEMANYHGYYCINQAKGGVINRANGSYIIGDNIHPTYDNYRIYGNYIASRIVSTFNNL